MRIGTKLSNEGVVIFSDVTPHGLHRACIEQVGKYPDVEAWAQMVKNPSLWQYRYTEKVNTESGIARCFLWLYWKE